MSVLALFLTVAFGATTTFELSEGQALRVDGLQRSGRFVVHGETHHVTIKGRPETIRVIGGPGLVTLRDGKLSREVEAVCISSAGMAYRRVELGQRGLPELIGVWTEPVLLTEGQWVIDASASQAGPQRVEPLEGIPCEQQPFPDEPWDLWLARVTSREALAQSERELEAVRHQIVEVERQVRALEISMASRRADFAATELDDARRLDLAASLWPTWERSARARMCAGLRCGRRVTKWLGEQRQTVEVCLIAGGDLWLREEATGWRLTSCQL